MSSFSDYLDGKYAIDFNDYLNDSAISEALLEDTFELSEEQKLTLDKVMRSARLAYDKAALNAKIAYARAIQEAKAAYVKAADGTKELLGNMAAGIKSSGKKVADGTVKLKNSAAKEIDDTIEEIKENKELAIKVGVASAVATASAIGLAYLIFRKRK